MSAPTLAALRAVYAQALTDAQVCDAEEATRRAERSVLLPASLWPPQVPVSVARADEDPSPHCFTRGMAQ